MTYPQELWADTDGHGQTDGRMWSKGWVWSNGQMGAGRITVGVTVDEARLTGIFQVGAVQHRNIPSGRSIQNIVHVDTTSSTLTDLKQFNSILYRHLKTRTAKTIRLKKCKLRFIEI